MGSRHGFCQSLNAGTRSRPPTLPPLPRAPPSTHDSNMHNSQPQDLEVFLGNGIRVLLLENDPESSRHLRQLLEERAKPSYSVETAASLQEAEERLAGSGWHVVLVDLALPGLGGAEGIRRLNDSASQIPIIVLGSSGEEDAALRLVGEGAQDFLAKERLDGALLSRSIQYSIGRKHTDLALIQSEEKYHRIWESIVEGIFQTTPDGHYLSANPALARIYGYDSPEDLMANITDIGARLYVDPRRRGDFVRVMEEHDVVNAFESQIYRKNGSVIWISENVRAIRDRKGQLVYYEGAVEDITERKVAEERLRNSETLYHSLVETLPQNIFRKDLSERFTFANQRFCKTLGQPLEAILGKTDFDFFPPGLAEKYQHDDRVIMESGKPMEAIEEHQPPDGGKLYVQVVKTPLYNSQGRIIGLQGIFWDITEKILTEQREREAVQALAANREELREKNDQLELDMRMAREIQHAMMPQQYPVFPKGAEPSKSVLRFAHLYFPTGTVGGDFFNILPLSDNTAAIFICDVMGHGVRSALVTAMVRALVEELKHEAEDPGHLLTQLNRDLRGILQQTGNLMFTTAFMAVIDPARRALTWASAGHPKPLLARADGTVEPIGTPSQKGPGALGLFEGSVYLTHRGSIQPGDRLLLFTDGLLEVEGPDGGMFDDQALALLVSKHRALPLKELLHQLVDAARSFGVSSTFQDDVCILGAEFVPDASLSSPS